MSAYLQHMGDLAPMELELPQEEVTNNQHKPWVPTGVTLYQPPDAPPDLELAVQSAIPWLVLGTARGIKTAFSILKNIFFF